MIDLFRPYMNTGSAIALLAKTLGADEQGRVYLGEGPRVAEFEKELDGYLGLSSKPLAMSSCTAALDLALHLAGIVPPRIVGDLGVQWTDQPWEVISTPVTCTATNGVIVNRGARIVWADVDPLTGLIDPQDVARKVTHRTKAVMAVDWAGRSCNYLELRRVLKAAVPWFSVPIIQDAAHNFFVNDLPNRGDYTALSFQAIKFLTTGDGGALVVPEAQRERARLLRWYGLDRESSADYRCSQSIQEAGYKYHMNDIAASIGLANLPAVGWVTDKHHANAFWYEHHIQASPAVAKPPWMPPSSWWLYSLVVDEPAAFTAYLKERDIAASPVHARNDTHPAFHFPNGPLPGVDAFADHEVSIPVGWWLSQEELERVTEAVNGYSELRYKWLLRKEAMA